jgi:adenylyl-sulfate kinase
MPADNLTRHRSLIEPAQRWRLLGHRGAVVWLTGLSGSGKSTIAYRLERTLIDAGRLAYVLDGDNVRHGLCSDLGFSPEDRAENIRRVGEVAALFADAGAITISAFISPYRADRSAARAMAGPERFAEVYLDVPVAVCERRDPKGLYARARSGDLLNFTGVSAPYQAPQEPELVLDTDALSVEQCVDGVIEHLRQRGIFAQ